MRTHTLADLDVALIAYCTSESAQPVDYWPVTVEHRPPVLSGWMPTTEERIDETGLHPVATDRRRPARHASPWCADRVLADALDGLDRVGTMFPRHKDPSMLGGAIPLLPAEIALAAWTVEELSR